VRATQLAECAGGAYHATQGGFAVNRNNVLYLIIGALVITVAVLGYQLYQDRHPPEGVQIQLGPRGLSIQGK
jgi:RsiW-degrading membrane proteinase PrsW (M82 family)